MNRRFVGLDHGLKRIGVAVSDGLGLTARELAIIVRKSKAEDFTKLNHILQEQRASAVIVGLPSNLDLPEGVHSQADTVRVWVEQFKQTTRLPIVLWDEQMTSVDALELARQKGRKSGEPIDDLAARVILQSYLDALRDGMAELPPETL